MLIVKYFLIGVLHGFLSVFSVDLFWTLRLAHREVWEHLNIYNLGVSTGQILIFSTLMFLFIIAMDYVNGV